MIIQTLQDLRVIFRHALSDRDSDRQTFILRTLKRVIRLFHDMATNPSSIARNAICVPDELHSMLEYKESCGVSDDDATGTHDEVLHLIEFLAKEATPNDFLKAFAMWTSTHEMRIETVHVLQTVLRKGAHISLNTELSGLLLRLRRARLRIHPDAEKRMPQYDQEEEDEGLPECSLWKSMSEGIVTIEK